MKYGHKTIECGGTVEKDDVACFDKGVAECLIEGVLKCFDKNNRDFLNVDFILAHPLE